MIPSLKVGVRAKQKKVGFMDEASLLQVMGEVSEEGIEEEDEENEDEENYESKYSEEEEDKKKGSKKETKPLSHGSLLEDLYRKSEELKTGFNVSFPPPLSCEFASIDVSQPTCWELFGFG
ncbi:Uncharacterized protein Rs2_05926 [Raphanus sativus]|nr:Uncharacterized protein Rs2_05926 [Raphanus sativus]